MSSDSFAVAIVSGTKSIFEWVIEGGELLFVDVRLGGFSTEIWRTMGYQGCPSVHCGWYIHCSQVIY